MRKHMMGLFYFRRGAFYSKRGVRGSGEGRRSRWELDGRGGVVISRPELLRWPTGRILRVFDGVHTSVALTPLRPVLGPVLLMRTGLRKKGRGGRGFVS